MSACEDGMCPDCANVSVETLCDERTRLAKFISNATLRWPKDHACAECVPGGEIVVPGFRCAVHLALSIVAARREGASQ
jgi:hypothetical protein